MKRFNLFNSFLTFVFLVSGTTLFTSCDDKKDDPVKTYANGIFVVNEGNFSKGNGAISFYDASTKNNYGDVFNEVNSRPLGDNVQSLFFQGDKAYVVVNNSNKIEVANAATFAQVATIENLKLPRYMTAVNTKGYVTETISYLLASGQVSVIDLNTHTIKKTISVGTQPDQLLAVNAKIYVTNSGANTISVINTATDVVESTITVGDSPNSLVLDANGKLWVLCGGKKVYNADYSINAGASTAGSLVKINLANNTIESTLTFASKTASPNHLITNKEKNKLFYSYTGSVYQFDITASALPTTHFIKRNFYGINIDPGTNLFYGADAGSFTANGKAVRYNTTGVAIDSFQTGIAPNGFIFK